MNARCVICGEVRRRAAVWPIGAVCFPCYGKARARPSECSRCGQVRVLVGGPKPDTLTGLATPTICGVCEGSNFTYLCHRCGGGEEPYKGGLCVRCAVRDQLEAAFPTAKADAASPAAKLVEALGNSRRPRSVMKWLTNPRGGARIVGELLHRNIIIDHAALDTFDEREVWPLRRNLVELGALPERHEPLARLDAILLKTVTDLPPEIRRMVHTYGSWWVLRRSRQRYARTGKFTYGSFRHTWLKLESVASFLTWLTRNGTTIAELDQNTLNRWMAEPHSDAQAASDFLHWASRHHLAPHLTVTYPPQSEPNVVMTEEERWASLSRCFTDGSIPDDVRAAGALVLLYGIQLARIVELTRNHLARSPTGRPADPEGFSVSLGGPVVLVPPPLAVILGRLPAEPAARGRPLIAPAPGRPEWLFPGRGVNGHITYAGLAHRMRTHGLRITPSRNAALIALASELPAPVISDLFGLSVSASVNWVRRAGRDWQWYIAALQRRDREPNAFRRMPDDPK